MTTLWIWRARSALPALVPTTAHIERAFATVLFFPLCDLHETENTHVFPEPFTKAQPLRAVQEALNDSFYAQRAFHRGISSPAPQLAEFDTCVARGSLRQQKKHPTHI
jgi:hypothetical protein